MDHMNTMLISGKTTMAIVAFAVMTSAALADVEIDFADGRKEIFVSATVEGGKLKCVSRYGVLPISPTALGAVAKARYFPEAAASAPVEKSEPLVKPAAPAPMATPQATPAPVPTKPKTEAKSFFTSFEGKLKESKHISIKYPEPLSSAQYFVHIPAGYDGIQAYGLVTFINAANQMELPLGWEGILEEKKLIFVAAQNAGNDLPTLSPRLGLGVAGARAVMRDYKIDPKRVYVSGFSGGARCATILGYYASDLFSGVIALCGANFHEAVPRKEATAEGEYGVQPAAADEVRDAKRKVRFALITGETDWRRGNIADVFHGGYEKQKFQARLWEVPGLGHAICGPETLKEAVEFLEETKR
jgi:hypothetical protein